MALQFVKPWFTSLYTILAQKHSLPNRNFRINLLMAELEAQLTWTAATAETLLAMSPAPLAK